MDFTETHLQLQFLRILEEWIHPILYYSTKANQCYKLRPSKSPTPIRRGTFIGESLLYRQSEFTFPKDTHMN